MKKYILMAPDAIKAREALRFAIQLDESELSICAYEAGDTQNRYYAHRTIVGISCRFLDKEPDHGE